MDLMLAIDTVVGAVLVIIGFMRLKSMKSWGRHNSNDEIDVKLKTVLITGASSGIGKEVAYEMLRRGAIVIIPCRSMDRALATIADLKKKPETSNGTMVPMEMDLTSLTSIRVFATNFKKQFYRLNFLINNAGVFTPYDKERVTNDGFEYNFGVNYLSHFLLTDLLLDQCKAAASEGDLCRIINVSSMYHQKGELRLDDLNLNLDPEETMSLKPYHNSKLAQVYFSYELSKRVKMSGVHTYCLCPGWVKTNLGRDMKLKWYQKIALVPIGAMFMRTPNQGCQTILHCALSNACGPESGKLYRNCAVWTSSVFPLSEENSTILWEKSVEMVK